ncbi:hypothetical protein ACTFIT_000127 [Dictyostelium discoideum]
MIYFLIFIFSQQLSSTSSGGGLNSGQLNNSFLGGTGRLQSNLTDFSFEFNGNDKKEQQEQDDGGYNRQSLINENQSTMSSLNNTNEPIINTGDVKVNSQKVKTFEQTVSGKVELLKFIRDKNFYAISSCATKSKEDDQQQQQQQLQEELSKPFTKQQYDNMMNGTLDVTAPNPDIPFSSKYIKHEDSKYQVSTDISLKMSSLYLGNSLISKFCTDYSKYNYLELVLRAHKNYYVPLLLPFYKTSNPKDIKKDVMLQTDLENFPRLMKSANIVKYFVTDEEKMDLFFELAGSYHKFTTLEYIDPSISTCKFSRIKIK